MQRRHRRTGCAVVSAAFLVVALSAAPARAAPPAAACGEVVTIKSHGRSSLRYSMSSPVPAKAKGSPIALVLLAGGGGHLDLDDQGCPRALKGNSLVRSVPLFNDAGLITVLVDSPSNYTGEDGLAGFRVDAEHANDLGKVVSDVRQRTAAAVWVVGTSRGTISAVNAASRLAGASAPDGVVLTSALMQGDHGAHRAWVAHTVFDLPLESIRAPVLVVGHADDRCLRSPPGQMQKLAARLKAARKQVVTVSGGGGRRSDGNMASLDACQGRSAHGFLGQEAEVAAGIARFVRGQDY